MSQRIVAVSFIVLLLVSGLPATGATHTGPLVPDMPALPRVRPSQDCTATGLSVDVLQRVNQLAAGNPAFFQDELGVPAVCVNGVPVTQVSDLIIQFDSVLARLRETSDEIQDQVDYRLETTLPEGSLPNDLVEPKTVLLNETFNGRRTTGFGDWQVITEGGEAPLWQLRSKSTLNGTRTTYRFGTDDGYVRGAHQWLVSPEIDLTALKANKTAIQDLVTARDLAKDRLRAICYNGVQQGTPPLFLCQEETDIRLGGFGGIADVPISNLYFLLQAYEMAFDETIFKLPVMQHGAFLELSYRLNMAPSEDGVRVWLYSSDRAPDRSTLFNPDFGRAAEGGSCVRDPLVPLTPSETHQAQNTGDRGDNLASDLTCVATLHGGQVISHRGQLNGSMDPVRAFTLNGAAARDDASALSGDVPQLITQRFNLTDFIEQRVWLLFEAKTLRNDRGSDIFNDAGRFTRFTDFGFEVSRVYVEGDGYLRNLRLKEIGATYPYVIPNNAFGDAATVRTTVPPGNESISVYLHNAGDYTETANFSLAVFAANKGSSAFNAAGTYLNEVTLVPDEVKVLRIPWSAALNGNPLKEGSLYRLNGSLELARLNVTAGGATTGLPDTLPPVSDPNNTRIRPANAAGTIPEAGNLSVGQLVRSATLRNLTPVRMDGAFGVPLQFCAVVDGTACDELYAAAKGESRIAFIGVKNAGNAPQDIQADLVVTLDGVVKNDIINGGPRQTLRDVQPGETRAVKWALTPTEPGSYHVSVAFVRSDGVSEPLVERRLFVQRSTGLICLDTIELRECGPSYSGSIVPILKGENITAAAFSPNGTLYVATQIAEATPEDRHTGMLAARDASGTWTRLANLSGTLLNQTFTSGPAPERGWGDIRSIVVAPDASLWLVGENTTVLHYAAGVITPVPTLPEIVDGAERPVQANLTSALWHNGTLIAGGQNGTMLRLVDHNMTRFFVSNTSLATGTRGLAVYQGTINALVRAPNGAAFLLGDGGVLLRNSVGDNVWAETTLGGVADNDLTAWRLTNASLHAATTYGGRLYVAGADTLLVNKTGSSSQFVNVTRPAPLQNLTLPSPARGLTDYIAMSPDHLGGLQLLDYEGRLAICDDCLALAPQWLLPEVPRSAVVGQGATHPARITLALSDGAQSVLLGEAGLVVDLRFAGDYANDRDWSTVPSLASHDGGVLQTIRLSGTPGTDRSQSYFVTPNADGQSAANDAAEFRLYLNHSARIATPTAPLQVRLVYVPFPSTNVSNQGTCDALPDASNRSTTGLSVQTVCGDSRIRHLITSITTPTATDGWEARTFGQLPAVGAVVTNPLAGGTTRNGAASFHSLEFFESVGTMWAIDDYHLVAKVGNTWKTVVEWRGPDIKSGSAFLSGNTNNAGNSLLMPTGQRPLTAENVNVAPKWQESVKAFEQDLISPWHVSTQYADRPVFAANNEAYLTPELSGGNTPRIFSRWDSRLVSPVIDLRDAYDPTITFAHKYAFRILILPPDITPNLQTGEVAVHLNTPKADDGGFLEVQYLKQGMECGSADITVTCGWSQFYVIKPDGGYPTGATFGLAGDPIASADAHRPTLIGRVGANKSYFARSAIPDESGVISSPRLTDNYDTARVTLKDKVCSPAEMLEKVRPDCVPVDLSGRQIRFAFHIVTGGDGLGTSSDVYNASAARQHVASYPGEGWYITDFKVMGARKLGIDLTASNLSFRVGYDVDKIGVGPNTRVPVTVAVHNNGTFDALGYTGKLEVRRVIDRALKITAPVETITLSQQPVLESNKTANHTFFWSVPSDEGAQYVLSFTVEPIGIDRDEDFLDNNVRIGSVAEPITARTVRRFNTEFLVSPENATIDITRYMPMFINNTGNVPLEGFTVERRITVIGRSVENDATSCALWRKFVNESRQSSIVDCRQWTTTRAAPAGALTPLTVISDTINPTVDLFWKAPERANFLVSVSASTNVGTTTLTNGLDRRVSAFATYLFDDVEGGIRGESTSGAWITGPGWNASQPGFRSTDAYTFGDPLLGRYPANANDSIVSPTIDIGNARTASIAFYQKYRFEEGFDGGLIEASADGGKTWAPVPVSPDTRTSAGYNQTYPVQAGSPLHPNGDPDLTPKSYAFTSDSSKHPAAIDGWVLSQVDLTGYTNVTEPRVPYEAYTSVEIQNYDHLPAKPSAPTKGVNAYSLPGWCRGTGGLEDAGCWEVENLTQGTRVPPTLPKGPENTMWWSGSASPDDDGKRPIQNHLVLVPLDVSTVTNDQVVMADWWEYASRFSATGLYTEKPMSGTGNWDPTLYTVYSYATGLAPPHTTRYNLGKPEIVETRGKWYHMQADITGVVRAAKANGQQTLEVGFSYTPLRVYSNQIFDGSLSQTGDSLYDAQFASDTSAPNDRQGDYGKNRYDDDPGFAIDGFTIEAKRFFNGQVLGAVNPLADETTAWTNKRVFHCSTGTDPPGPEAPANNFQNSFAAGIPCLNANGGGTFVKGSPIFPSSPDNVGYNWALVNELPGINGTWGVVNVRDHAGYDKTNLLPTGAEPKAWWTGELPRDFAAPLNDQRCRRVVAVGVTESQIIPCPQPGSESRLVTPAFDLGRVAGNNAQLSFWHRFAFSQFNTYAGGDLLSSGGAVEISEFDAQTNTWKPWQQLYTVDSSKLDLTNKGGYTAFTSNSSDGGDGRHRFDPPFENNRVPGHANPVQFLYSGMSTTFDKQDGRQDGWIESTFDVSPYLGKRVRFGFHSSFSDEPLVSQGYAMLTAPDGGVQDPSPALARSLDRGGWWISDVSLIGNVIVGKPIQVRWRAGSDGNVQDGSWQLDDIGVFGSRYRNNVGLFVDTTPGTYGAYNDSTSTIPVTLRNLGNSVRRDLAVEIVNVDKLVPVNLSVASAPQISYADAGNLFRVSGYTLAPGQSVQIDILVKTPRTLAGDHTTLLMQVKEFSQATPATPYVNIADNEVQGLLMRIVPFGLQSKPDILPVSTVVRDVLPVAGQPVELEFTVRNPGYGPSTLTLACKTMVVSGWVPLNHQTGGAGDQVIASSEPACERISGNLTVPAKSNATFVFRATPTTNGFLRFDINGTVVGGSEINHQLAGVAVGISPIVKRLGLDGRQQVQENFTLTGSDWDYLRGHDAPGSIIVGLSDNATGQGRSYDTACFAGCRAVTHEIDLHNFSVTSPAFLSFYHMDHLARYDGARVVARVKVNEQKAGNTAWSDPCIVEPRGGWEGSIRQVPTIQGDAGPIPGDENGVFQLSPQQYVPTSLETDKHFFTSFNGWEDSWSLAVFDLSKPCVRLDKRSESQPLVGNIVRFEFEVFSGSRASDPAAQLRRGVGQGMFVDDISISPYAVSVSPLVPQRAALLDNTTKEFHVVVRNDGKTTDKVTLEYDARNSSAPLGSVHVASESTLLAPGESRVLNGYITLPRDPSLLPTEFDVRLVARSLNDRNAAGATTVKISFGPRPWAELSLFAEAPTNVVQEGTEAFIPITIENLGLVDSINTTVRITDTWAGGRTVIDLPLSAIPGYAVSPEDSTRVLEFRWRPDKGSIGVHTLVFQVDPENVGEEYTKSNNIATLTVPVSDLLIPDLFVGNFSALTLRNSAGGVVTPGFDADVARYEVTAGELTTFEIKVSNIGRAGATNVDVRAFIGALSLPPKKIPYIAPGNEVVVTFNWLAQKGEHEIEFVTRSEQVELSTANNRYPGTGVTLLTVKGYEIEVAIGIVLQNDAEKPRLEGRGGLGDIAALLEPGTTIEVPFSITNAGNAGEDLVLIPHTPPGTHLLLPREGFFLRAGETYADSARLVLDAEAVAGQQVISIDAVARDNPMKVASGHAKMAVNASYGGSVAGGIAAGAPPGFVLPIELVNEGNSLEPWSVTVRLPAGWTTVEALPVKISVPAHGKATLELHLVLPSSTAPGERVMQVKAQLPNGEKRDGLAYASVLPMRAAGLSISDKAPLPDKGSLTVPVIVENKGNVQQPFQVLVLDAPTGITLRLEPSTFDLPPGGKAVAALIVKPNASVEAGTYSVTSYTLFQGVTPQTAEGRANLQTIKVPIVRQDLRLSALEFSPRAGLDEGQRVTVKVSVSNRGATELAQVPVHLFVDDVFIAESIIATLPAGSRADVSFNWTALLGTHTLTAVVDPFADTVDADRADNAVSALATVGSETPSGAVAAGKAGTPGPGVGAILMVALAAALLVTLRNGSRRQRR